MQVAPDFKSCKFNEFSANKWETQAGYTIEILVNGSILDLSNEQNTGTTNKSVYIIKSDLE